MKRLSTILTFFVLVIVSCTPSSEDISNNDKPELKAKGGRAYGGTFKMSETEIIHNIYPPSITAANEANVAQQVFECLVKFDPRDLSVKGCLAESWDVDATGTKYTFHLKKGVKFHDDPCFPDGIGRELTASDVKYSFERICTQSNDNLSFSSSFKDRVLGANEYYEASANGKPNFDLSGLKVIDDYTVELSLVKPRPSFPFILAHPALSIIPVEAVKKYGNKSVVGTGPFMLAKGTSINDNPVILVSNKNYHGADTLGNRLPFLDTIMISIMDSKKSELEMFLQKKLHVVNGLPSESIREIVEEQIANFQSNPPKYILARTPEMATNYYTFNLLKEHFKDIRVRKAINYAIDRNRIIDQVLNGEAYGPGEQGICPPSFSGYDIMKVNGYSYDPDKAKILLAEAGYPNGKNFPTIKLELNSGGYKNTSVAFEVQKQLMDNLNINVDLEVVPFSQKLEDERLGNADIFRSAWIADYPSPETFLYLFYGKNVPDSPDVPSYPNTCRYVNEDFDALYDRATASQNQEESYELFIQAEQLMLDEAPIIVLWYNENYKLIHANVKNYYTNPMNYRDFSEVYFKKPKGTIAQQGQ